jgi:hypothetical protein
MVFAIDLSTRIARSAALWVAENPSLSKKQRSRRAFLFPLWQQTPRNHPAHFSVQRHTGCETPARAGRRAIGSSVDAGSGCLSPVWMMETADQRYLDHFPIVRCFHRTRDWTVVKERPVRPDFMVIFQVGFQNAPELLLIGHDHSIQALPPASL